MALPAAGLFAVLNSVVSPATAPLALERPAGLRLHESEDRLTVELALRVLDLAASAVTEAANGL